MAYFTDFFSWRNALLVYAKGFKQTTSNAFIKIKKTSNAFILYMEVTIDQGSIIEMHIAKFVIKPRRLT